MIRVADISMAYGDAVVLHEVSLTLPQGGLTAIIGPNGAGKSTLLSIMARLLVPRSGSVHVGELDVFATPGPLLARRLAILRQENHVTPRLTVQELVQFGRYPHSRGRPGAEDARMVAEAIGYVGLETLKHQYLDQMSGGQRQRAFLAMVLAQDTDYLLLDEPLNSLDMKHAAAMMALVRRASRELGKTVVVVLHDINFASCHADTIVALKQGRVFAHATPAEIMTPVLLKDLYEMNIEVVEMHGRKLGLPYF